MDVGSVLICCVLLGSAPNVAGDENSIQMIIRHQTSEDNMTVTFSQAYFKKFYNCMCPSAWTRCRAQLTISSQNDRSVIKVSESVINTKENGHTPRYFTCFHNATSETIVCSLLFDDDEEDGDDDDDDDVSRGATEWLHLRREDCDCVGIKWRHLGETIFSKSNRTSLQYSDKSCQDRSQKIRRIVPSKGATTIRSSHIKTAEMSGDNNAEGNHSWIIITTVVVILGVIILVLLFIVFKRGCNMKNFVTRSFGHDEATTAVIKPGSVTYTVLEHAVSTIENNEAEVKQAKNDNMKEMHRAPIQGPATAVRKKETELCDDPDLCYVEIHDTQRNSRNNDSNYDVIDDNENDDEKDVTMAGLAVSRSGGVITLACNANHQRHRMSEESDVYESYDQQDSKGKFANATAGFESKDKIEEETVYSSADESCEVKYTSIVLKENISEPQILQTDNSYEKMGVANAGSNNDNNYKDVSTDSLLKSEQEDRKDITFCGDGKIEEHCSSTQSLSNDAGPALVYSMLRHEVCERTHLYDELCDSNAEQM